MKNILIIFLFLYSVIITGQNISSKDSVNENELPSFPGGITALKEFLKKNIVYPSECSNPHFAGCKVFVKFMVNEDGTVSDPQIVKGCQGLDKCDAEVLRVISLMPKWNPAKKDKIPFKRSFSLPVSFKNR